MENPGTVLLDDTLALGQANPEQGIEAGFGALATERGPLPLAALDVTARLDGLIAHVEVAQTFVNVHELPLEATYIFPLPDRAAVTGFRLEVAGRVVEGELQERGAARQQYEQAIQAGHRAAIAEEERPGVFTLRVGNLPPGERARVRLQLVGPMPYRDGEVEFRFPLVVAPRYVPGAALPGPSVGDGVAVDTDAVPDASRISPPVLLPGFPNPVRLGLAVEVVPSALEPHAFRSSLHTVVEDGGRFRVCPGERLDRDFVFRYRLAGDGVRTALALEPDADGKEGTFCLTLVPPARTAEQEAGRDLVFVLDRSGSMGGWKMVTARRAVARMVESLTERDRFAVYAFDDCIETVPGAPGLGLVSATDRRRFQATEFLGKVEARGGTEMAGPLQSALAEVRKERVVGRQRLVVLITDGQVANEDQMLRTLGPALKEVRVFALGIDTAVNAGFLRRLAEQSSGGCELVESEARLDEVMDAVHRQLGAPVLAGLRLKAAGLGVVEDSVAPSRLPDLFAGRPVTISGRYRGRAVGQVALRATTAEGQRWGVEVGGEPRPGRVLAPVWARGRVRDLEDRFAAGARELERAIVETSLRFGVLCRFTAYVAVDRAAVVNEGGRGHQIVQPVEQPAGWADTLTCAGLVGSPTYGLRSRGAPAKMLAKQVLAEVNQGGQVSKKDQLAVDDVARMAECMAAPLPCAPPPASAPPAKQVPDEVHARVAEALNVSTDELARLLAVEEPPPASPTDPANLARPNRDSLLGHLARTLRSLFGGKGGEEQAQEKKDRAAPLNRTKFRERARRLVERLEGKEEDGPVLRGVLPDLTALVADLRAAGEGGPIVERLSEGVQRANHWLTEPLHGPVEWQRLRAFLLAALRDWLALPDEAPARAAFWK